MGIIKRTKRNEGEHAYIPELKHQYQQGRISRRDFLRNATLLGMSFAGASAFLAACGGTEAPAAPTAAPAAAATEAPAAAAPTAAPAAGGPKYGGTMRCSMQIIRVDHPARYSWVYDSNATGHFMEYLVETGYDNVTRPKLLEKWEPSDDLKTWDLYLKEGIKFNNGDELTADDILFNFSEWLNPEVGSSMIGKMPYLQLSGVEKVDDYHVRLNLDVPAISVPEDLYHYPAQILHRGFEGDIIAQPVGTGPFTLQEYSVGERVVHKRREDYWGKDEQGNQLPFLDEIIYVDQGEDQTPAITALKQGQIDTIYNVYPTTWEALKDWEGTELYTAPTAATRVLRMRVDKEPWTDNKVRQALKLCQDRQKILDLAYFGQGVIAQDHHVSPAHPDYAEVPTPEYDPEKAKALLAEAGYPDGLDVEIAVGSGWDDIVAYAETLKQDAEPAGFRITLNSMPNSQYWELWTEVDLGITSWTHRPLGTMVLELAYTCDANGEPVAWNETRWCDDEFTTLLTQANGTPDVEERRGILEKLELIQQERGSIGNAYYFIRWNLYPPNFRNVGAHPTDYHLWSNVWIDEEA